MQVDKHSSASLLVGSPMIRNAGAARLCIAALVAAALLGARGASGALVTDENGFDGASQVGNQAIGGATFDVNSGSSWNVGLPGSKEQRAVVGFSIDEILTDTGFSIAQLQTARYRLMFDMVSPAADFDQVTDSMHVDFFGYEVNSAGGTSWENTVKDAANGFSDSGATDTGVKTTASGVQADLGQVGGSIQASESGADDLLVFSFATPDTDSGTLADVDNFSMAVIPEPASLALLAPAGLLMMRRRRRA